MTRTRREVELALAQERRTRSDWIRWYGGFDPGYVERSNRRLADLKAELAQLEEGNGERDEHEQ